MAEQRHSAMQRIQVGIIGLFVVLLFVSLANMVIDRVTSGQSSNAGSNTDLAAGSEDETPDEPLAELGVTPVAKEEDLKGIDDSAPNIRQVQPQR
jgi:uncharacterized membrane protein